ncbi:hypothetical protein [Sphingobacterium humi]|uniref:Uncharacterized protein n=1 Tax=Sphingobacterium humi TaxID=1796905 RepID=A0A6N8KZB1_9SPHI|nr:hypothetical protein [Sphingobacterium humi]MVZ62164.1 hypothetical protein [Sphingobacterium humi]
MNKELLDKYIKERKVIEFLEKLELQGINTYNDKYIRLLEILIYLINNVNDRDFVTIQQYLFKTIYKVKGDLFNSEERIESFIKLLRKNSNPNYDNITSFNQRFILNLEDNIEELNGVHLKSYLKNALLSFNEDCLRKLINKNADYKSIINVFYCCVNAMELPERKVIISDEAIKTFLEYIEVNPIEYLSHFIRPYYSQGPTKGRAEYYLHVGEPFLSQIFMNGEFKSFLNRQDKESKLVSDIANFYNYINNHPSKTDKIVMIFSNDNTESENLNNHLKLESDAHVWVRPGCRPTDYKE